MIQFISMLIKGYRYFLSPWLGNHCRFYPSCSQYAQSAIQSKGLLRGGKLIMIRLLKCHPWHSGGIDLVPGCEKKS